MVATNRYLLFDNGCTHNPQVSRAVEYELDLSNRTARVVWQYPGTPTTSLYSYYMGNDQRLSNGNTLINWAVGNLPKLTEVQKAQRAIRTVINYGHRAEEITLREFKALLRLEAKLLDKGLEEIGCGPLVAR